MLFWLSAAAVFLGVGVVLASVVGLLADALGMSFFGFEVKPDRLWPVLRLGVVLVVGSMLGLYCGGMPTSQSQSTSGGKPDLSAMSLEALDAHLTEMGGEKGETICHLMGVCDGYSRLDGCPQAFAGCERLKDAGRRLPPFCKVYYQRRKGC